MTIACKSSGLRLTIITVDGVSGTILIMVINIPLPLEDKSLKFSWFHLPVMLSSLIMRSPNCAFFSRDSICGLGILSVLNMVKLFTK